MGERQEVGREAFVHRRRLTRLDEALGGVLPEGLQQAVAARTAVVDDQGPVGQAGHVVGHRQLVERGPVGGVPARHRRGGGEVERAGEDRQGAEDLLGVGVEEVVRPAHGGLEGAVAVLGPPAAGEEPEALAEPGAAVLR